MKHFYLLLLLCCASVTGFAQVAISPTGDGGFETGSTFAANGWTVVNSSSSTWQISAVSSQYAGSRAAFISPDGGSSYSYNANSLANTSHIYKDVSIPAGATGIVLSWYMKGNGETGWDRLLVFTAPTSVTPTADNPASNGTSISGATNIFIQGSFYSSYTLQSVTLPNTLAGTTVRVIFTWQNDNNGGGPPPASVDNISLTYTPVVTGIAAAPSPLAFGGVSVGGYSSPSTLTISGASLTGFPGNLTVTAPTGGNYELSYEGVIWSSSLTIPYSTATLASTPILVRFHPTALTTYCSGNITISGGGAPTFNVPVCGTGANACSAAPTAGTASITPTSGGSGTSFAVTLPGASVAGNLTYQWRSSLTGTAGSFTDITGATGASYSFSGLSATTYYQCNVTCPTFGTATSGNATATFVLPSSSCTPDFSNPCSIYPMNTSIASLVGVSGTITDPSSGCAGNYLDNSATMSCSLSAGTSYSATINVSPNYPTSFSYQVWIDFNDDGSFSASESVGGQGYSTSGATTTCNLSIPAGSAPGTHRLRIVGVFGNYSSYPSIPSCPTTALPYGQTRDYSVNILPSCSNPAAITGNAAVCLGVPNTFSSSPTTGTWTSSNTSIATVSASGVVNGVSSGPAMLTYSVAGGCKVTRPIGVYNSATVASITPSGTTFCTGNTITFTAGSTTGSVVSYNWSGPGGYSATTAATVPTALYVPTAITATGAYSLTVTSTAGCVSTPAKVTPAITVNGSPAPISGTPAVCQGATTPLGDATASGTWSSGSTSLGTVSTSGVVSGLSAGLANISYTLANTCFATVVVSVNPLPILNITPASAAATICMNSNTSFTANSPLSTFALINQNFDGPLTGWTITNGVGSPASWFHTVTPAASDAGIAGDGSLMLQGSQYLTPGVFAYTNLTSPSFSTVGYGSATLTFNQFLVSTTPDDTVRIVYSIDGGNTWSLLLDELNYTSLTTGSWTAATPDVTVNFPAAALGQPNVRLKWNYHASSLYWYIDNISVNAALPAATYAWTGAAGLSCTTCTSPVITPAATGANNYNITATSFAGCITTNTVTVNVNPLPTTITGNTTICVGTTTTLNSTPGGTWFSSASGVASIVAATGVITGSTVGTTNITYTLPTGCITTTVVSVLAAPAAITGPAAVCQNASVTLSHPVSGGIWSASNTNANVLFGGVVNGITAGPSTITYTLPSGCTVTKTIAVNATPNPIGGSAVVCEGGNTTLTEASPGGAWTTSSSFVASVTGPVVTGNNAGNAFITYTLPTTCYTTVIVTVNAAPAAITGANNVCVGAQTPLNSATLGGTWTSAIAANATVNTSGIVTGANQGSTTIIYALSNGCQTTWPMTINPLPNPITGANNVCQNSSTFLSSTSGGGAWTSGSATIATVLSSGMVTGAAPGNTNITYTLLTGCKRSVPMLVNPRPAAINGNPVSCEAQCVSLSDFTADGAWSSDAAYIATVDPSTGMLCGVAAGNTTISYTLAATGCARTVTATINALPAPVTGGLAVCKDMNTSLSSTTGGGAWTTSNSGIASVATDGTVTGVTAGNANITYALPTGCRQSVNVVVNPLPAVISGSNSVCEGATTQFTDATAGIVWSSLAAAIADVNPSTGMVTGYAQGNTTIITTITATGCTRTKDIIVNPAPAPVSGSGSVCQGAQIAVSDATINGTWSASPASVISINPAGTLTGVGAGNGNVTYTLPEGCTAVMPVVVNPLPALISGPTSVCEGLVAPLTDPTPGIGWSSSNTGVAAINAAGVVTGITAGTATTTCYVITTGCYRTRTMTVNPQPAAITGTQNVCAGLTTSLTSTTTGGTWTSTLPGTASVNSAGFVTGLAAGTTNIIYRLPTSCLTSVPVTVFPQPASITGPAAVCPGLNIQLASTTSPGTWTSSDPAIASVSSAGIVTGGNAGPATITYSLGTGCLKTKNIVVNPAPGPITGNNNVCVGHTTSLGNSSLGGTWGSSTPSVAAVNSSGLATGINGGFTIITYTLPTGCINTTALVVSALPAPITGNGAVCAGSVTTLTDVDNGGAWSSASAVASVNATGDVTGVAAGTTIITYSLGSGCQRLTTVTVNPLPELITGSTTVCQDAATLLNNNKVGGIWSTDNIAIANIDPASGLVSGMGAGTTTVTYTLPTTCLRTRAITVNPAAAPITGTTSVCAGLTTTLASASADGVWTSGNTTIATINPATGVANGMIAGNATVTYTLPTGCMAFSVINVNALPPAITGTLHVCAGAATALSNMTAGGTWNSGNTAVADINTATGMVTGNAAGNADITYTLGSGCIKTTNMIVNPLPAIDTVTGGGSYCAGGAGMHIGLKGSQAATTYRLYNSASSLISSATGSGTPADFGLFTTPGTYTVNATSSFGCSSHMYGNAMISVTPLVTPSITISASADTVCQGAAATYTATVTNGGTAPVYAWKVNGGPVLGTAATFSVAPTDGAVVTATLTSNIACPSAATVTAMTQATVIAMMTPTVSIAATPGNKVCQGAMATFTAAPSAGGTEPLYTWVAGGSINSSFTGPVFSYIPKNNDVVYCKLASSYRCVSVNNVQSNNITMTVDSIFIPAVSIIANTGTEIYKNTVVTFTTTVTKAGSNPTYQWLKNGADIPGATAATYIGSNFSDGDSVTCMVTGTGACGYPTINSVTLHVLPGSGPTGVAQTANVSGNFTLMPNPNNGGFVINGSLGSAADQEVSLEVTDVLGQIVYRSKVMARNGAISERIQLSNTVANGMYMLNLHSANEHAVFHFVVTQ